MKTILATLILLLATSFSVAQTLNPVNISFVAVPNICGAPSDVHVKVITDSPSMVRVDLILLDDNDSPVQLVESRRLNPFGNATFLAVQPCMSYHVRPKVLKGNNLTFTPTFIKISVQDGEPFNLEFTGVSN